MKKMSLVLIVLLLFIAGIVWLQIFLSKKKSKVPGIILPSISFIYSLMMVLSIAAFQTMKDGEVFGLIASTLLLSNIPTIILIAIYIAAREKIKRIKEIEKMNIQDLQ